MSEFAYVIDDDEAVRVSLRALLGAQGERVVVAFASAEAFLAELDDRPAGVLLLDLHMPGMSGMALLNRLGQDLARFPAIVVTGRGDVPLAVKAMLAGAIDFLEKPYEHQALFAAVDRGFASLRASENIVLRQQQARARIGHLSPREREVLMLLVDGASNRAMADQLGLSVRTVEVHRANLMAKLNVTSLPAAINLVHAAGMVDAETRSS